MPISGHPYDDRQGLGGQAALLGAAPDLNAGPALISIVLVVFIAFASFLIVRCSTPLSKWASTAPSSGSPHPKSDVSDFGHLVLPNSGSPVFGAER